MNILNFDKNITLGFIATLFLFTPFYSQYHIAGEGLFITYNVIEWLVMGWFLTYGLFRLTLQKKIILPKYFWTIVALPIGILISGFVTGIHLPIEWLFRILFIMGGVSFLFLLFQCDFSNKDIQRILLIVALSSLINAIICIIQVHFPNSILNFFPITQNARPDGAFKQINTSASYSATGLLISTYLLSLSPYKWRFGYKKSIYSLVILIFTIASCSYVITLSASRVGVLSAIVGFILLITCRWLQFRKNKIIFIVILSVSISGVILGSSGTTQLSEKIDGTFEQYSSARMGIYSVSVELIKQSPIFGHGIGSFHKVFTEQAGHYLAANPMAALANVPSINHPHNEFFFWLIEGGILSVIGIIISGIMVVIALNRIGWSRGGAYSALLLPITLHTQVELPFYLSAIHWFLFLLIIFIILRHNTYSKELNISRNLKISLKISVTLIFILSSSFLLNCLKINADIVKYNRDATGQVNLLEGALNNVYFSNYAERSLMALSGARAIAYDERENVVAYTVWAESYIQNYPDYVIREILVRSYWYLGEQEEMCSTLKHGLFLYPKNQELLKLNNDIFCF